MRTFLPAPYEGLNLRDGYANQTITQAGVLRNGIPRSKYIENRKGADQLTVADTVGAIRTLAPHPNGAIAVGHGSRFSIFSSTTDTMTSANTVIGLTTTTGIWNYTQHSSRIILCNGLDTPRVFDGAAFVALTVTSGPVATSLWACQTFKGRVFYWYESARSFWYPAAGSYQGVFNEFSLASFVLSDASLIAMIPLTNDGGSGPDDLAAFVFNNGEVLLYQGDDPASVDAWQQIGRFRIPRPYSPMGWCINGSTSIVDTKAGPVDLAKALSQGPIDNTTVVGAGLASSNVQTLDASSNRSLLLLVPDERVMVRIHFQQAGGFNSSMTIAQFMDMDTRGWSQTSQADQIPWGYSCFGAACVAPSGVMYMGSTIGDSGAGNEGQIWKYATNADEAFGTQYPIFIEVLSGATDLGYPGQRKQITALRPVVGNTNASVTAQKIGFAEDFAYPTDYTTITAIPADAWLRAAPMVACSYNGFQFAHQTYITTPTTGTTPSVIWYGTEVLFTVGGEL